MLVEYDDRSILERHLDATGHTFDDPGRRLAATIRKRRLDDPSGTPKERKTIPTAMAARADLREAINEYDEFVAFMSERIPTGARPVQPKYLRNKQLEKRGKLLKYDKVDDPTKLLLNESRLVEWNRYKKYNAVTVISRQTGLQMIKDGAEGLPTQWIEVDRNEKERTEDNPLPPEMRSRLLARG